MMPPVSLMSPGEVVYTRWDRMHHTLTGRWPEHIVEARLLAHAWKIAEIEAGNPCPICGGERTAEGSAFGPYVFCVECGFGGQD